MSVAFLNTSRTCKVVPHFHASFPFAPRLGAESEKAGALRGEVARSNTAAGAGAENKEADRSRK